MKTYYSNEEVKKDIVNGVLIIDDDIEIAFDGFFIDTNINCHNIYSKGDKRDIIAWNITAWNITARDIKARNIKADDISAGNIKARDILYYAHCIAYYNIKCKSIKGRRSNSFHKCLDGKLTIEPE